MPAFTISPDEDYLVFWEWVIHPSDFYSNKRKMPEDNKGWFFSLASVNLNDHSKRAHSWRSLPGDGINHGEFSSKWSMIGSSFSIYGWLGGEFIIYTLVGNRWLVIDPRNEGMTMRDPAAGALTCSDCPPKRVLKARVEQLNGWADDEQLCRYSAAWRDGQLSETTYRVGEADDGAVIVVIRPDSTVSTLVDKHSRFKLKSVAALRVSPDERYLAYVIWTKLKAPFPTPDHLEQVYVLDLKTGKERSIAKHRFVGGLMWSPRGERLYFSGSGKYATEPGIFVIELFEVFGK